MADGGRMDWLIRGGTVVTGGGARVADVGIRGGTIALVGAGEGAGAEDVVDAAGRLVLPGGIDPHVHLDLPTAHGRSADSFASGTRAAVCGGVTCLLDFALYETGLSLAERLAKRRGEAEGRIAADCGFHVELGGPDVERLDEIRSAASAGYRSFKVYMAFDRPEVEVGPAQIRRFAETLADSGSLLVVHAEDGALVRRRLGDLRSSGRGAPRYHGEARPPEAEARAIDALAAIGLETGVEIYVVHVSSRAGLDRIREGRVRGARLRAETCPHYLLLTAAVYEGPEGLHYLANPPLRTPEDCEALWEGLADGTIDTLATDHCPFARSAKMPYHDRFWEAPKGLPGVETRLPLLYSEGVRARGIPVSRMADLLSTRAAGIFGLGPRKGTIAVGADADLVVLDPGRTRTIRADALHMNTDFSPYEGMTAHGWPTDVFLRGRRVFGSGEYVGGDGDGRILGEDARAEDAS